MVAYLKVGGGFACLKKVVEGKFVSPLTSAEMKEAEEAKTVALCILEDALRKKDRVLMEEGPHDPMPADTAAGLGADAGAMKRYAIVTPSEVRKLIDTMKKIQFKKDSDPSENKTFAYVYSTDKSFTVYLCPRFWSSRPDLTKDSRPGTLIHEVSHFLGSEDITYAERNIKVVMGGNFYEVGANGSRAMESPETHCDHYGLLKNNANSIEFEFEICINHKKKWNGSCFPCCGERARHSVCNKAVPEEFTFFLGK